jgi:hypothetical protein
VRVRVRLVRRERRALGPGLWVGWWDWWWRLLLRCSFASGSEGKGDVMHQAAVWEKHIQYTTHRSSYHKMSTTMEKPQKQIEKGISSRVTRLGVCRTRYSLLDDKNPSEAPTLPSGPGVPTTRWLGTNIRAQAAQEQRCDMTLCVTLHPRPRGNVRVSPLKLVG